MQYEKKAGHPVGTKYTNNNTYTSNKNGIS